MAPDDYFCCCCTRKIASIHLYTWVERGTLRVKCVIQAHYTMSPARTRTRTAQSGVLRAKHEAIMLPTCYHQLLRSIKHCYMLSRTVVPQTYVRYSAMNIQTMYVVGNRSEVKTRTFCCASDIFSLN